MNIRKPAVAGYFYPDEKKTLKALIDNLILEAMDSNPGPVKEYIPKAIIVPHAGYVYSGPVAAHAYGLLRKNSSKIKRVILAGPSHRVYVQGIALSSANFFETPLGKIELDSELREKILKIPGIQVNDEAHRQEHSLEVQLPFLQTVLNPDVKILPAVTNMASPNLVNRFLEQVWGGEETLIVISSDLSHYLGYQTAMKKDRKTAESILGFNIDQIEDDDACGSTALKGFLLCARNKTLKPALLDLRNSGDTGTDKEKVVGYGAFCFR